MAMNNPTAPGKTLQTPGFSHYSVAWSPFHPDRLALASSANFGLVGNGRLHIVQSTPGPSGSLNLLKQFPTQDGLYDLAWSEVHENQLVTASGDGSLKLWDISLNELPICAWQEHTREVFSVDWSNMKKDSFISSSWDGKVKVWTPDRPRSITTIQAHTSCVYQAVFSPHHPDILASCSADGSIKVFDLRSPLFLNSPASFTSPVAAPALTIPPISLGGVPPSTIPLSTNPGAIPPSGPSTAEVLSIDWNKYKPFTLASGGVDKRVREWDCRMMKVGAVEPYVGGRCEVDLVGHEYAIRKVQWSPHQSDLLASASYDMTCRVWNTSTSPQSKPRLLRINDTHTEFVVGCAWSLYEPGVLASCAWDCRLHLMRL